jgi:hypothetical protein
MRTSSGEFVSPSPTANTGTGGTGARTRRRSVSTPSESSTNPAMFRPSYLLKASSSAPLRSVPWPSALTVSEAPERSAPAKYTSSYNAPRPSTALLTPRALSRAASKRLAAAPVPGAAAGSVMLSDRSTSATTVAGSVRSECSTYLGSMRRNTIAAKDAARAAVRKTRVRCESAGVVPRYAANDTRTRTSPARAK